MDYKIVSISDAGNIEFTSGTNPERVTGLTSLVQEVLIELLSDYDSRTARGCNLIKNINDVILQNPQSFAPVVSQAIRVAQTHIIANQSRAIGLTSSETLLSLELLSATITNGNFAISLQLTNFDNQTTVIQVPV